MSTVSVALPLLPTKPGPGLYVAVKGYVPTGGLANRTGVTDALPPTTVKSVAVVGSAGDEKVTEPELTGTPPAAVTVAVSVTF